jgi:hypothetical protein
MRRQRRRQAGVAGRRHRQQALLLFGRQGQAVDEALHQLARHGLAAGEGLQLLVGVGQAVAAHHGLDRLGQHFPGGVEVGGQRRFVELQLVQAAWPGCQASTA